MNSQGESAHISVRLKDILAILEDAVANRRAFLEDFQGENITMSRDLFEVLVAYQRYHPQRETA